MANTSTCPRSKADSTTTPATPGRRQPDPTRTSHRSRRQMAPRGRPHHQRAAAGRLRAHGDSVWDAQQVSAGDGLQPDVLWGQDRGARSDSVLLAAALVPGYPGPGTGGNSVHHHHLHPEVTRADDPSGKPARFLCLMLYIRRTHFTLIWIGICSESVLLEEERVWRGPALLRSDGGFKKKVSRNGLKLVQSEQMQQAMSILQDCLACSVSLSDRSGVVLLLIVLIS